MLSERLKTCYRCGQEKPVSEFNRDRKKPDGISIYCAECGRKMRRDSYSRNRKVPEGIRVREDGVKIRHEGHSCRIYWDGNMVAIMKRHFPRSTNQEMLELLGHQVSLRTMLRKAREMDLEKDPDWLRGIWDDCRMLAHDGSRKKGYPGTFQKGRPFSGNQYVNADKSPKQRKEKGDEKMAEDYCDESIDSEMITDTSDFESDIYDVNGY